MTSHDEKFYKLKEVAIVLKHVCSLINTENLLVIPSLTGRYFYRVEDNIFDLINSTNKLYESSRSNYSNFFIPVKATSLAAEDLDLDLVELGLILAEYQKLSVKLSDKEHALVRLLKTLRKYLGSYTDIILYVLNETQFIVFDHSTKLSINLSNNFKIELSDNNYYLIRNKFPSVIVDAEDMFIKPHF
jgi:hypothetical protein